MNESSSCNHCLLFSSNNLALPIRFDPTLLHLHLHLHLRNRQHKCHKQPYNNNNNQAYCWTYANEWQNVQQKLNDNNVLGPIFVSVGDSTKLNIFLEKNPLINKQNMFVDSSSKFDAYDTAGFTKKFTDTSPEDAKAVKLSPPKLNFKQWITYITSVGQVSPIPKDQGFGGGVPEGVLRLGGTFVVKGNDIIYQWNDRLPGDHPDIDEVLSIAVSS
jgi:hypothetical protein